MKYYELREEIAIPHGKRYHRGARMTKDEWIAAEVGFVEDDFDRFGGWFREHEDKDIEVDLCADVVITLLDVPTSCGRTALQELERTLRTMESEAQDVTKAYGLRIAADWIRDHMVKQVDPTPEEIKNMVRQRWEQRKRR